MSSLAANPKSICIMEATEVMRKLRVFILAASISCDPFVSRTSFSPSLSTEVKLHIQPTIVEQRSRTTAHTGRGRWSRTRQGTEGEFKDDSDGGAFGCKIVILTVIMPICPI